MTLSIVKGQGQKSNKTKVYILFRTVQEPGPSLHPSLFVHFKLTNLDPPMQNS